MAGMRRSVPVLLLTFLFAAPGLPQESAENEAARRKLKVAPGMDVSLWASDPQLENPVAISIDERGRIYVAEAHRRHTSTLDIHMRKEWLDDDLACRRHEDLVAYHLKRLGEKAKDWMVESERIRVLEDRSGTGRADHAVTFSDGYRGLGEGIGAGILVRNGEVWYACIPNLWYLKGQGGDGKADVRKVLHTGFGVHLGASGHDMHGLRFGPDGKLYWSHGDRGFHVEAEGKIFDNPDGGGVFRCNPDGSDLELVCTGLRNPQELQFDQFGNLFTGDNNISIAPDVGETCRWTYIVEGADYGWRIGYQFMPKGGAWCEEEQWKCEAGFQAPFVARLGHGPSGVTYHPGVAAIPKRYLNHFFMCDYPGGIWSFEMKPKGASFEMVDLGKFLWELQAPDVEFGPDGAVYVADWVGMWDKADKGRIWKVVDPALQKAEEVRQVRKLIEEGMREKSPEELAGLLGHADQRVRQAAQFELVARKLPVVLLRTLHGGSPGLARLHALWGLGQLGQKEALLPLLEDPDAELRAQAAKVLGGMKTVLAYDSFVALLHDPSLRVRFFAALGLGKIAKRDAVPHVAEFLRANNNEDRMLQHAGIMALTWIEDVEAILKTGEHASPAVRMAALVALRKLNRPEVTRFLADSDPKIVLEAARAIYDTPLPEAFPALALLLERKVQAPERALLRAVNAAFRLGKAELLAATAAHPGYPSAVRIEALKILAEWEHPSGRDRLMGLWRPIPERERGEAVQAVAARMGELFKSSSEGVVVETARVAGLYKIEGAATQAKESFQDRKASGAARAAALRAMAELKSDLSENVAVALDDPDDTVAQEAVLLVPQAKIADAAARLEKLAAGRRSVGVRQASIVSLGALGADVNLGRLLDNGLAMDSLLEWIEAARQRPALKGRLEKLNAERAKGESSAAYPECLEGGDLAAGRKIFFERGDVQCVRCHAVGSEGGQVGPPLTTIGSQKDAGYLLESILYPNKQIAEGWGQTALQLKNDAVEVGRIEKETEAELTLMTADGQRKAIPKGEIKARKPALSSMPEGLSKYLSNKDLRDLVAFLRSLK
jgi:quinoprotein glucose dehydrogenase